MSDPNRSKRTTPNAGPRVFNPVTSLNFRRLSPLYRDFLESIEPNDWIYGESPTGVSHIFKDIPSYFLPQKIVVSIHGACRGNGTSSARAAYGVFFGKDSPYNESGILPETEHQGSNAAVIYAAKRALEIVEDRVTQDITKPAIKEVIIKTHSSYLFLSMVEDVLSWEKNGYIDSRGKRVGNRFLIGKLENLIEEAREENTFATRFWLVGASDNEEGVPLAEEAFNRAQKLKEHAIDASDCPLSYWILTAPEDADARELARRLRFRLHDIAAGLDNVVGTAAEVVIVIRRLVITGEDREQNFECLFGTEWTKLKPFWAEMRLEVLEEFRGPSKSFCVFCDGDAPFHRPRRPDALEEEKLSKLDATKKPAGGSRRKDCPCKFQKPTSENP
ncbi:hypothetical protein V8E51_006562 [Hyaloscypha variabilis]